MAYEQLVTRMVYDAVRGLPELAGTVHAATAMKLAARRVLRPSSRCGESRCMGIPCRQSVPAGVTNE